MGQCACYLTEQHYYINNPLPKVCAKLVISVEICSEGTEERYEAAQDISKRLLLKSF